MRERGRADPGSGSPRHPAWPTALKVNPWSRASAIVLGLIGLAAGDAAVFITHLEAGPVALLAVGLLLLLIGMGRRMPNRLKIGDNEAAWDAVEDFVERVADDVSQSPGTTRRGQRSCRVVPHRGRRRSQCADYKELALYMAQDAVTPWAFACCFRVRSPFL